MQLSLTAVGKMELQLAIERQWAQGSSLANMNRQSLERAGDSMLALLADMGGVIVLHTAGRFAVYLHEDEKEALAPHNVVTPSTLGYAIRCTLEHGVPALSSLLPSCWATLDCHLCQDAVRRVRVTNKQGRGLDRLQYPVCAYWTQKEQTAYLLGRPHIEMGVTDLARFTTGCVCSGRRRIAAQHYPRGLSEP